MFSNEAYKALHAATDGRPNVTIELTVSELATLIDSVPDRGFRRVFTEACVERLNRRDTAKTR